MKLGFVVEVRRWHIFVQRAKIAPTAEEILAAEEQWKKEEWERIKQAGELFISPLNYVPSEELMLKHVHVDLEYDDALRISDHFWRHGVVPKWALPPKKSRTK